MRVLQLIDTLHPGGAERMAVSYANALAKRIEGSYICCTREEGMLKKELNPAVGYAFLEKKSTFDIFAFLKLRKFVRRNRINIIQAHSSSWFLGLLVKKSLKDVRLIWHDHYGRELSSRKAGVLKAASSYFDGIIAVNPELCRWSMANLNASKVEFVPNFVQTGGEVSSLQEPVSVQGEPNSFKIICVANLRPQKDHTNLLKCFEIITGKNDLVSLHLVGQDLGDEYSQQLKEFVLHNELLKKKVFFYGEQENVVQLMGQCDLGILSSSSEGLPVALLEYGFAGLPVVVTNVGECATVVDSAGRVSPPGVPAALAREILYYLGNPDRRQQDAGNFRERVRQNYSEEAVLEKVLLYFNQSGATEP